MNKKKHHKIKAKTAIIQIAINCILCSKISLFKFVFVEVEFVVEFVVVEFVVLFVVVLFVVVFEPAGGSIVMSVAFWVIQSLPFWSESALFTDVHIGTLDSVLKQQEEQLKPR